MATTLSSRDQQSVYAPSEPSAPPATNSWAVARHIAAYSSLILFFELAWIRYTSAYVRVFGFYQNFVLIATFLGMGVGLMRAKQAHKLKWLMVPGALLLPAAVWLFSAVRIGMPKGDSEFMWGIFGRAIVDRQVPLIVVVITLFSLSAFFFVPFGALLGDQLRRVPALFGYTADVVGSLLGITAFALVSAMREPPLVWMAIGFVVVILTSLADRRFLLAMGVTAVAALGFVGATNRVKPEYWSPYYRINVLRLGDGTFVVEVNGSLHQIMVPFDSAHARISPFVRTVWPAYTRPYQFAARMDTVLVVGAGTGNDLSLLLRAGAKYIDAVEIDPTIADIGAAAHPLQPYANPRVHRHIDDARAFLRRTNHKYDLIVFGTLDSQTLLSGMSSVRLDNYVYTVNSFESARSHLKPDGTLIAYHMSANDAIAAKLYQMLTRAFGSPPGVFFEFDQLFNLTFVAGHGARNVPPLAQSDLQRLITNTEVPTDNWPYLYLTRRTIPAHYVVALAAVLLIALAFVGIGGRGQIRLRRFDGPMFFMGAGFLLVETKSVTEMSLLFGSTWMVNVLVFAAILVMIFVANLVVSYLQPRRVLPLFGGLLLALGLAYALPTSALLPLPAIAQWITGGLMVALPVFFAALIFAILLADRPSTPQALGWNVLGAVVGGVLEYSSMALGVKFLYVIAALLYIAAAATVRASSASETVERDEDMLPAA